MPMRASCGLFLALFFFLEVFFAAYLRYLCPFLLVFCPIYRAFSAQWFFRNRFHNLFAGKVRLTFWISKYVLCRQFRRFQNLTYDFIGNFQRITFRLQFLKSRNRFGNLLSNTCNRLSATSLPFTNKPIENETDFSSEN